MKHPHSCFPPPPSPPPFFSTHAHHTHTNDRGMLIVQGHTEVWPLITRRAHALGGKAALEDSGLHKEWLAFLQSASRQPALSAANTLKAVVFLLAQVCSPALNRFFRRLQTGCTVILHSCCHFTIDNACCRVRPCMKAWF